MSEYEGERRSRDLAISQSSSSKAEADRKSSFNRYHMDVRSLAKGRKNWHPTSEDELDLLVKCGGKACQSGIQKIVGHRQGVGASDGTMWVVRSPVMENLVNPE